MWNEKRISRTKEKPILVLMPGLTGNNDGAYLISLAQEGRRRGYDVVIINYRGASGVPLTVIFLL